MSEELLATAHAEPLGSARQEHAYGGVRDAQRVRDFLVRQTERRVDEDLALAIGEAAKAWQSCLILARDDIAAPALFEAVDESPARTGEWMPLLERACTASPLARGSR